MSLSISDFQKISNGTYNAGDITLTSSGKLDKVNNHVGLLKGWNNKSVNAATTLAVKNAFVQALQDAGIDAARLADVRKDLGLPQSGSTKGFDLTTLKPLTRAQTREILDRFSATITITADYTARLNQDVFGVEFTDKKTSRGMEVGMVSYTYQFTVTGLGTGHPQVASAGFGQTITARDLQQGA